MRVEVVSHDAAVDTRTSGGRFTLLEPFRASLLVDGRIEDIQVPAGFSTDFASIPRPLWAWAAPHGKHSLAAVVHDYLYLEQRFSRRVNDAIFYRMLRALGVRPTKAWAMWAAVRIGGGKRYKDQG